MDYLTLTKYLAPEIVLVLTAFAVLMLDLNVLRREPLPRRFAVLGSTTLGGLALAAALALWRLYWDPASFFADTFVVDPLNGIFALIIIAIAALITLISLPEKFTVHVSEYYALILFAALGMEFMIFAEELIMIFVSLELTAISLFALTAFDRAARRSIEAAIKYMLFGALSTAFLLFGMSYLCGLTGQTSLAGLSSALTSYAAGGWGESAIVALGVLLLLAGFGYKLAAAPFHGWAPDTFEGAPLPVTSYIASGSKVAAFLVAAKILITGLPALSGSALWGNGEPGWTLALAAISAVSMVLGNLVAILQKNVKRLLAYSSIAHAGYILVGLLAFNRLGMTSLLYYIVIYALTNIGAFAVLQIIAKESGGETMADLAGAGRRSPLLALLMVILVLSLAGVPPMGGFIAKFLVFAAAIKPDAASFGLLWLVALAVAANAVALYYYLLILKQMYIIEPANPTRIKLPRTVTTAAALCVLAILYWGIFPQRLLAQLESMSARLF